jgi:integrase
MKKYSIDNLDHIQRIVFQNIKYDVEVLTSEDTEYIISQEKKIRMMLSKKQSDAMDYLIVALFMAPRVGDMKKWDSSNLYVKDGKNWLTYVQEKTGTKIDVPINSVVYTIFSRNLTLCGKLLPECPTNLNKSISGICSLVPSMQCQGSKTRIRGGKITEIRKPKWEMISIHRMRATAITNMLDAGVPEHVVKSYSGHTGDSKAFARYVKSRDNAKTKASETYIKSIAI